MNRVVLSGRLTSDPEIRYTQGQKAVASFAIAVRERKDETEFFECTAWDRVAEHMEKYWHKGMKAIVAGRLKNEAWTTKDGQKRTQMKVVVEDIEFCEKKEEKQEEPKTEWAPVPAEDEELPFKF